MMKLRFLILVLVVAGVLCLGCGDGSLSESPGEALTAVKTLRPTFTPMPTATNTAVPTYTPLPTDTPQPQPTSTPLPPSDTPEPTKVELSLTDTPLPPTPTSAPPTATRRPATRTPAPPTATPMPAAKHVVGSHGVSGLVIARDKTTFSVGEKAFFTYEVLNHTEDPVGFELLGIKASNGLFNTSWVNPDFILPDVPFRYDDGLTFSTPGTYQVFLAICFARCGESDADWEEFPYGAATITVR